MKYSFTQSRWSEEPDITEVQFNSYRDFRMYKSTQSMWFEEPGKAKVLFIT